MIVIKEVEVLINKHLKRYQSKIQEKYFEYYLKFYFEEILLSYYHKYKRESYNHFLANKEGIDFQMKFDEIYFENNHQKYPRVLGKYFNLKTKRIRLYFQIKKDFIEMELIELSHCKWVFQEENSYTSTKEIYRIFLPENQDFPINVLAEIGDNTDFEKDYHDEQYSILYNDLLWLTETMSTAAWIKLYTQFYRLKNTGFKMLNDQRRNGTGPRIYSTFCYISEPLRNLIRDKNGELFTSIDLVSSHIFWLAEYTGNKQLYQDVKSKKIKDLFSKKRLITWLNSANFKSNYYKKINEYFQKINLDTAKLRTNKGLYPLLAKMEGDYVIDAISNKFPYPNYTVHDQIYYQPKHEDELNELIAKANRKFKFTPVWSRK